MAPGRKDAFVWLMDCFGASPKWRQRLFSAMMIIAFTSIGYAVMSCIGAASDYYNASDVNVAAYEECDGFKEASIKAFSSASSILAGLSGATIGLTWSLLSLWNNRGHICTDADGYFMGGIGADDVRFLTSSDESKEFIEGKGNVHKKTFWGAKNRTNGKAALYCLISIVLVIFAGLTYTGTVSGGAAVALLLLMGVSGMASTGYLWFKNRDMVIDPAKAAAMKAAKGMKKGAEVAGKVIAESAKHVAKATVWTGEKVVQGTGVVLRGTGEVLCELGRDIAKGRWRRRLVKQTSPVLLQGLVDAMHEN